MWIKICANTNLADAQLAAALGADALGFVFAPSSRQVTVEQVARIIPHLPPALETIAVVQSRDPDEIAEIARHTGVTGVQLHGGLDLPLIRALHRTSPGLRLIQTLHWTLDDPDADSGAAERLTAQFDQLAAERATGHAPDNVLDRVLLDAKVGNATGGTGRSFDWQAASATLAAQQGFKEQGFKLIVAGGLHSQNISAAIQALQPWGVDVASGVEASPGRKDPAKLQAFIENARARQA
jgi:phosphoribosylanthranilate isomerase